MCSLYSPVRSVARGRSHVSLAAMGPLDQEDSPAKAVRRSTRGERPIYQRFSRIRVLRRLPECIPDERGDPGTEYEGSRSEARTIGAADVLTRDPPPLFSEDRVEIGL